jgi:hypothetical protein
MHKRVLIVGLGLMLLVLTFIAMVFTFRYEVDGYYEKKNNAEFVKQGLEDQINFLTIQLARPESELNPKILQTYDETYGINIQEDLQKVTPKTIKLGFQHEMDEKKQQLQSLEKRGLLSYIPEWPLLILGALGVIATRMINYFMDVICCFFKKK